MNTTRFTATLLIIEGLLIFAPLVILGTAINWPASLNDPASKVLPLLYENIDGVRLGYLSYLIYSVLFLVIGFLVIKEVAGDQSLSVELKIALGFAAVSTLARCIGIIRWLSAMPLLASLYVNPATSSAMREAIEVSYTTVNAFGGAIGEVLGVSLFASLWLLIVSATMLRQTRWPRWLGGFGIVAASVLALPIVEIFGFDLGPIITISTTTVQFWFLAAGIRLFWPVPNLNAKVSISA